MEVFVGANKEDNLQNAYGNLFWRYLEWLIPKDGMTLSLRNLKHDGTTRQTRRVWQWSKAQTKNWLPDTVALQSKQSEEARGSFVHEKYSSNLWVSIPVYFRPEYSAQVSVSSLTSKLIIKRQNIAILTNSQVANYVYTGKLETGMWTPNKLNSLDRALGFAYPKLRAI